MTNTAKNTAIVVPRCPQCRCPMEANPYGYLCHNCSYSYSDDDAAQSMSDEEWKAARRKALK